MSNTSTLASPTNLSAEEAFGVLVQVANAGGQSSLTPADFDFRRSLHTPRKFKLLAGLLDTLCGVLASENPKQVVAMSVSVSETTVDLIVAGNEKFPSEGNKFSPIRILERVWDWMKRYVDQPDFKLTDGNDEYFLKLLEIILDMTVEKVMREIYEKGNSMPPMLEFIDQFVFEGPDYLKPELKAAVCTLLCSMHNSILRLILRAHVAEHGNLATSHFVRVYRDNSKKLEDIAFEKHGHVSTTGAFSSTGDGSTASAGDNNLTRNTASVSWYISKHLEPYRLAQTLYKALYHIRHVVDRRLIVTVLPNPSVEKKILDQPDSKDRILRFLKDAYEMRPNRSPNDPDFSLIGNIYAEAISRWPMLLAQRTHCECLLLRCHLYLQRRIAPGGTTIHYPYIGVSKLSCTQCVMYFEAVNEIHFKNGPVTTRGVRTTHEESDTDILPCDLPSNLMPGMTRTRVDAKIESRLLRSVMRFVGIILVRQAAKVRGEPQVTVPS